MIRPRQNINGNESIPGHLLRAIIPSKSSMALRQNEVLIRNKSPRSGKTSAPIAWKGGDYALCQPDPDQTDQTDQK